MTNSTFILGTYTVVWIVTAAAIICRTVFPWLIEQQWFYN